MGIAAADAVHWTACSMAETDQGRELLRRMGAGDPSALRELYALYGQHLYAYAYRLTGDPATAEDVTQETLMAAWRGAKRFRGESRVKTWLLGIVHNTAMNLLRRRHPEEITEEMSVKLSSSETSPEQRVQAGQVAALVRRGLDEMSPKHREVLELVFYHGLSMEEAARVCNVPPGTIKSRLSYAKARLKEALARARVAMEDLV